VTGICPIGSCVTGIGPIAIYIRNQGEDLRIVWL
jgi:hypothetical protein